MEASGLGQKFVVENYREKITFKYIDIVRKVIRKTYVQRNLLCQVPCKSRESGSLIDLLN